MELIAALEPEAEPLLGGPPDMTTGVGFTIQELRTGLRLTRANRATLDPATSDMTSRLMMGRVELNLVIDRGRAVQDEAVLVDQLAALDKLIKNIGVIRQARAEGLTE